MRYQGRADDEKNKFPPGWDEERVQSVIAYYDQQTEDEAALMDESSMLIEVPTELVPAVRELIAKHVTQNQQPAE